MGIGNCCHRWPFVRNELFQCPSLFAEVFGMAFILTGLMGMVSMGLMVYRSGSILNLQKS